MELLDGYTSDLQPRRPGSIPRIAGPGATPNLPAQQVPWYTPEQVPRLAGPSAEAAGPLSRAAGMAPAAGAAGILAGGAAATAAATGTVAANPDYFKTSIGDDGLAANILLAADTRRDEPAQQQVPRIGQLPAGDSTAGAGRGGDPRQFGMPSLQQVPRIAAEPQYDDRFRAANLTNMQNEAYREGDPIGDIIRQKLGQSQDITQPADSNGGSFLPVGALTAPSAAAAPGSNAELFTRVSEISPGGNGMENTPFEQDGKQYRNVRVGTDELGQPIIKAMSIDGRGDFGHPQAWESANRLERLRQQGITPDQPGGQPAQNPIRFATFGGGTESSKAYYGDGTTADLRAGLVSGQGLPADVRQFNQQSAQAGQEAQQPVHVIKAMDQTMALPNPTAAQASGRMQEVPMSVFAGGDNTIKQYQSAQTQNAVNAADPLAAKTASEVAVKNAENKGKTDAAQIAADAHLKAAQLQFEAGKVPPGFQRTPDGKGVVPIPGSEAAQKDKDRLTHAQGVLAASDKTIATIDRLLTHPGREGATGTWNYNRFLPGTDAADFAAELETLKAQTFLPQVEQLKGMGALSDAEGKKLSAAVGALDHNMSEKGFVESLNRIKSDLSEARGRVVAANPGLATTQNKPTDNQPGNAPATGGTAPSASTPPASAPQAPIFQHKGAQDIRAQYAAGKITREQAAAQLSQMGFK